MFYHGWLENGPGLKMYFLLNMVIGPMPFGLFVGNLTLKFK